MKTKLLLLHGALGSKKQFDSIKILLGEKYDIYTMDFEGHGAFISTKEFNIQLFTENVIEFLNKEAIEKINVFGYSMGGYVALNTALHFPEKISKIVTLGTKFNWDIESAQKEVKMLNPEKIEEKIPLYAEKLRSEHHPQDWKTIVNKTSKMMVGMAEGKKLKDESLKQIRHEVLIGIGSLDKMVSLEESEKIAALLPNGKLKKLMGFEHPIDKIAPIEFLTYIEQSFA